MAAGTSSSSSSLLPPPQQHNLGGSLPLPGTLIHRCSDGNPSGNNAGRKAAEDKDLISEIPDSMIFEIFSFMPVEEIVRTTILSRRRRLIWTGTRNITVSCSDILCTPRIDMFFNRCTALAIQKIQISLGYAPSMKDNINRCISFAMACGAKDMELNFSSKIVSHEPRGRYVLPGILLWCRSIVRRNLSYCSLKTVKDCGINWGSLKALCINDALLEGRLFDDILDGSPSLEYLELKCCFGGRRIRLLSTRLSELVIDGHKLRIHYSRFNTGDDDVSLEIYAPYQEKPLGRNQQAANQEETSLCSSPQTPNNERPRIRDEARLPEEQKALNRSTAEKPLLNPNLRNPLSPPDEDEDDGCHSNVKKEKKIRLEEFQLEAG